MNTCGWVSTEGTFYGCAYGQHDALANKICRDILRLSTRNGTVELENRKWIKVTNRGIIHHYIKQNLTQAQVDTLGDIACKTKKASLRMSINRLIRTQI